MRTHFVSGDGDWERIYWHGEVFETLFVRLFLRLLGYDGEYIDYATPGWPPRRITDPCAPDLEA
jgi:hypothetical protein